jgi:hypothetical protein
VKGDIPQPSFKTVSTTSASSKKSSRVNKEFRSDNIIGGFDSVDSLLVNKKTLGDSEQINQPLYLSTSRFAVPSGYFQNVFTKSFESSGFF